MKQLFLTFILFLSGSILLWAQFPPQAGEQGSDAIAASDVRIVGWATGCTVQRGWQNIADTTLGRTSSGNESSVIGAAGLQALSLGDGGSAIITFDKPIKDSSGPDFAVFENGFINPQNGLEAYLEYAFVAVSSDGTHYVTFPPTSLTQDTAQIDNFTYMDAQLVNNLAGKYASGYGTPFDLSELADSPNLDIENIRYVKITDVVGSLNPQYASYDKDGRIINDPFPSPYPTGGFDLNAIAVLHQEGTIINKTPRQATLKLWPNPANNYIYICSSSPKPFNYGLYNLAGQKVLEGQYNKSLNEINIQALPSGIYYVICHFVDGSLQTLMFDKK